MNLIPEDKILDRLERLIASATRFEKSGGGKEPGLRAKMASQRLCSGDLQTASTHIILAETEMRRTELRNLALKIAGTGDNFRTALRAIELGSFGLAEEIIIEAGLLD